MADTERIPNDKAIYCITFKGKVLSFLIPDPDTAENKKAAYEEAMVTVRCGNNENIKDYPRAFVASLNPDLGDFVSTMLREEYDLGQYVPTGEEEISYYAVPENHLLSLIYDQFPPAKSRYYVLSSLLHYLEVRGYKNSKVAKEAKWVLDRVKKEQK